MSDLMGRTPECEFTAEQIRTALIGAVRDDEPLYLQESLAALLALHYPDEFKVLQMVLESLR